ncbi:hypothetical protein [Pseudooceanicola sp.]|uniref:hypothetical protein n=1 Tax=Pseudooceanicola sp. TaxID=1914328 RepID=UPI0040591C43
MPRRIASALIEHGRAIEWVTSAVLLVFALTLSLPGNTLIGSGFGTFRAIGLDEAMLATPLTIIAIGRLVALYINGAWRRSPLMRAAGAVVGAGTFGMLSVAFGWQYLLNFLEAWSAASTWFGFLTSLQAIQGASTGAGTYLVLAGADLLAASRSGADLKMTKATTWQTS